MVPDHLKQLPWRADLARNVEISQVVLGGRFRRCLFYDYFFGTIV